MSVDISVGTGDFDGILMYAVHRGYDQVTNQVVSAANQVWFDENKHPAASMFGVAETNVVEQPDAEILDQISIKKFPTLLFCIVKNGIVVSVLSRLEGSSDYNKIRKEFLRQLNAAPTTQQGEGGGSDDFWEGDGTGGLGLGIGNLFGGCPNWMPHWICKFPVWLAVLIIVLLVLITIKILK